MHYPSYSFRQSEDSTQYFFESIGHKGIIQKSVAITATDLKQVYNLGLGDYNPITGVIDDLSVSDNGDTAKILATIFQIANLFLIQHPDHFLLFAGNTPARNRLYRMAINHEFPELSQDFSLFGYRNDSWEAFDSSCHYEFFLIGKK